MVLKEHEYYQDLQLKPGFEFWNWLVKYKDKIKSLKLFIPETLLTDEKLWLIHSTKLGEIVIKENPNPDEFLNLIEANYPHDVHKSFYRPTWVIKRPTAHWWYNKIECLNWPKTLQTVRNGPDNKSITQRYVFSGSDRVNLIRMVYTKSDLDNSGVTKGPFTITATNKIGFEDKALEVDDENMSRSYLICPFDINSFTILINSGKSIDRYTHETK